MSQNAQKIHPTAIIGDDVKLAADTEIGPHCVLEGDITFGPKCRLLASVHMQGPITMGENNIFYPMVCIGFPPQAHWFDGQTAGVKIGDNNTFRESFTMHTAGTLEHATEVGNNNLFMTCSHVGHDCVIGNNCNLATGAGLGGHCHLEDQVNIGGNAGVHQFVRFGRMSFLGGMGSASSDVPPFCMIPQHRKITSLNLVGLRRSGASRTAIKRLKRVFELMLVEEHAKPVAIELMENFLKEDQDKNEQPEESALAQEFIDFCKVDSKRGISRHVKTHDG